MYVYVDFTVSQLYSAVCKVLFFLSFTPTHQSRDNVVLVGCGQMYPSNLIKYSWKKAHRPSIDSCDNELQQKYNTLRQIFICHHQVKQRHHHSYNTARPMFAHQNDTTKHHFTQNVILFPTRHVSN